MKISLLRFRVKPGALPHVLAEYREHDILASSGCRDSWLLTCDDTVTVVALWTDEAGYLRWQASSVRQASAQRLMAWVEELEEAYLADHAMTAR